VASHSRGQTNTAYRECYEQGFNGLGDAKQHASQEWIDPCCMPMTYAETVEVGEAQPGPAGDIRPLNSRQLEFNLVCLGEKVSHCRERRLTTILLHPPAWAAEYRQRSAQLS
jgi:hypothetical protein